MTPDQHSPNSETEARAASAGKFEREVVEEARLTIGQSEDKIVALALGQLNVPASSKPRWSWLIGVTAAAALAIALLGPWGDDSPNQGVEIPRGRMLGTSVEALYRIGALEGSEGFGRFTWSKPEEWVDASFAVIVYDAASSKELLRSHTLEATTWILDSNSRAKLPDSITWEVQAKAASGESLGSSERVSASR